MNIFPILALLLIGVPILELYLLIEVGGEIGGLNTVLLVIFTAVVGAALIRMQGFSTLQKAQGMMQQGKIPAVEMFEGVVLFFAAIMLLTPGFFTDTIGFLLLVPPLRRALIKNFVRQGTVNYMHSHGYKDGQTYDVTVEQYDVHQNSPEDRAKIQHSQIIEGEVVNDPNDKNGSK